PPTVTVPDTVAAETAPMTVEASPEETPEEQNTAAKEETAPEAPTPVSSLVADPVPAEPSAPQLASAAPVAIPEPQPWISYGTSMPAGCGSGMATGAALASCGAEGKYL